MLTYDPVSGWRITIDGADWASAPAALGDDLPAVTMPARLSRFAVIRARAADWVIQSPNTPHTIQIHHPDALAALLTGTCEPLVRLLNAAGLLAADDARWAAWPLWDRLAFALPRDEPPHRTIAPPFKPIVQAAPPIALERAGETGVTLAAALRDRRTHYAYAAPITPGQLGALLDASAAAGEYRPGPLYDTTRRPYPSAGAAYSLDIYALIRPPVALPEGIYHYDPAAHALTPLPTAPDAIPALTAALLRSTGGQAAAVQVGLFITTRLSRSNWKDRALHLAALDAGGLLQTLYLTAAALGVSACAIGGVPASVFAAALHIPEAEEPLLAACLMGGPPCP